MAVSVADARSPADQMSPFFLWTLSKSNHKVTSFKRFSRHVSIWPLRFQLFRGHHMFNMTNKISVQELELAAPAGIP